MQSYFAVRLTARHGGPRDRLFSVAAHFVATAASDQDHPQRATISTVKPLGSVAKRLSLALTQF
jgi:hypothetical protein